MNLRELERSRQIIRSGDVLVPRFVVSSPDGEFSVFADFAADTKKHEEVLAKLYAFIIWKHATAFVMSCEWQEPNAVCSIGVSRPTVEGMIQVISRGPPVEFDPLIKLEPEQIGAELPASREPAVRHVVAPRCAAPFANEQLGWRGVVKIGHGRIPRLERAAPSRH